MTALPAASYLSDASRTTAEQKTALEDIRKFVAERVGAGSLQALTIAVGVIVPVVDASRFLEVDTEGAVSSDDLTNITATNVNAGNHILIKAANATRTVVIKDAAGGAGQIHLKYNVDFSLTDTDMFIELYYDGVDYFELRRSYGADKSSERTSLGLGSWSEKNSTQLSKSADYTIVAADDGKFIDATTSAAWNLTFPSSASVSSGFFIIIRNSGGSDNDVSFIKDGTDTFNGSAIYALEDYETAIIINDGVSDWNVIKIPSEKKRSIIQLTVVDYVTIITIGNGKGYFRTPSYMNGMNLVAVHAESIVAGTGTGTDTMDIQIHNIDNALDMLSTVLSIDEDETGSDTAATAAVINASNDHVNTNDIIRIDVDVVTPTTAHEGLIITLEFLEP